MDRKTAFITCPTMLPAKTLEWLEKILEIEKTCGCALNEAQLTEGIAGADVIIIGGEEFYTLKALKAANPGLKAIFIGAQGDTFFSPEALDYLGKENLFTTGGGLKEVALATYEEISNPFVRKILMTQRSRNFIWTPASEIIGEFKPLSESTVSVIGAGGIGIQLLRLLDGKCKKLRYHDPFGEKKDATSSTILWEPDLARSFQADFVTLHLKLGEATKELITDRHLDQIPEGGWFINNARAGLVNPDNFLNFLKKGGRAIWDVFYQDWEGKNFTDLALQDNVFSRITKMQNFFFTSHTIALSPNTIAEYGEGLEKIVKEKILQG